MRWRVVVSAALLLGTLGTGLWCRAEVATHCRRVEQLAIRVQDDLENITALDQALGLCEARLPFLSSLLNHEVLEQVGTCLARAKGCLSAGDRAGCLEQLDAVLYLLDDIREYDDINWKNLL